GLAVQIVRHEEPAPQTVLAQQLALRIGKPPFAHLDRVQPRRVIRVAFVEIDGLLDAAYVYPREPSNGLREVAIRSRIVLRPKRDPNVPVSVAAPVPVQRTGRKHQPREDELGLLLPIRRELKRGVLDPVKL